MPEVEALEAIADGGYVNAAQIDDCEADKITPAVPVAPPANKQGDFYAADVFVYDAESDSFTCPSGRKLLRNGGNERDQANRYRAEDCSGCPLKRHCTSAPRRYVYRLCSS